MTPSETPIREAIIRARRGQGLFKNRVMEIETKCRVTGVCNPVHLLASHVKPWRDSKNEERLDGEDGGQRKFLDFYRNEVLLRADR